jgi:hypothetical protein
MSKMDMVTLYSQLVSQSEKPTVSEQVTEPL